MREMRPLDVHSNKLDTHVGTNIVKEMFSLILHFHHTFQFKKTAGGDTSKVCTWAFLLISL